MERFDLSYDRLIFDPLIREYYRGSGFYNVGLWEPGTADQPAASAALVDRLIDTLPSDARRLLDVACGLGATTGRLLGRFARADVLGVNISERQLEHARAAVQGARFACADAARLDFPDGSFDGVLCVEAAFHFQTRAAFLAEAYRVLRPGGRLALSDMLTADDWPGAWTVPAANHLAGPAEYADLLAAAGFTDVRIDDRTDACWGAYCRGLRGWLAARHGDGRLPDAEWQAWSELLAVLETRSVRHYLLVGAARPSARASNGGSR